jgi:hypothetical protein
VPDQIDFWSSDLLEVGFATSGMSRDDEVWVELAEQWGRTDLDDLLSTLMGPTTDEA